MKSEDEIRVWLVLVQIFNASEKEYFTLRTLWTWIKAIKH